MSSPSSSTPNATEKSKAITTADNTDVSVKSLATQVVQIATLVKQNTKLLMQHGEDIMRIEASRMGISSTNGEPLAEQSGDQDGIIGELVQELQIKLDELEERSIRRTANSFAQSPTDVVEWMPLSDPEATELPAMTLAEFENTSTQELLNNMKLYGLAHYEEGMPLPNQAEFTSLFNECARFLGVRSRKTS